MLELEEAECGGIRDLVVSGDTVVSCVEEGQMLQNIQFKLAEVIRLDLPHGYPAWCAVGGPSPRIRPRSSYPRLGRRTLARRLDLPERYVSQSPVYTTHHTGLTDAVIPFVRNPESHPCQLRSFQMSPISFAQFPHPDYFRVPIHL